MSKSITITLPIYYTQVFKTKKPRQFLVGLNWYRNCHHSLSNTVKHYYSDLVKELIGSIKFKKIRVHYSVYAKRHGTDGHNIRAVIEKFFMDGLVNAGTITDDSIKYAIGDSSDYSIDKDNPRIVITVSEV